MDKLPWKPFINAVGNDLLPVVVDPKIEPRAGSSLRKESLGKVPSIVVNGGAAGVRGWSTKVATLEELKTWSNDPRLGFGMRCNKIKAITIDAATSLGQVTQRDRILKVLGSTPSIAVSSENDPTKGVILFVSKQLFPHRSTDTPYAEIEYLTSNNFLVLAGGKHDFKWSSHLEGDLMEMLKSKKRVTTTQLNRIFD